MEEKINQLDETVRVDTEVNKLRHEIIAGKNEKNETAMEKHSENSGETSMKMIFLAIIIVIVVAVVSYYAFASFAGLL